jgi:dTMP kinase
MERGVFIVLEGGEGAGKSTQAELLTRWVLDQDRVVTRTREPGGTAAAEAIREVLLDVAHTGLDDRAEALLFAAARGDHAMRVIRPALERGEVVVCDRFMDSSVAYQGVGRDLGRDVVRDLSLWATRDLIPDVTIVLDVDPSIGLARVDRPDRLEAEPLQWHARVRQAFIDLADEDPQRYLIVDATDDVDRIAEQIIERVRPLITS